jgi:hypothetical protein
VDHGGLLPTLRYGGAKDGAPGRFGLGKRILLLPCGKDARGLPVALDCVLVEEDCDEGGGGDGYEGSNDTCEGCADE